MSKNNKGGKKEFAPNIGFWPAKSGRGYTCYIDDKTLETLNKAAEGGRLFLEEVPSNDNPKAPAFRLTFFNADVKQAEESI